MARKGMREISKNLAERDRARMTELITLRRTLKVTQAEIDQAFAMPDGWTKELEAYDSDPSMGELRIYEGYLLYVEEGGQRGS